MSQGFFPNVTYVPPPPSSSRPAAASNPAPATSTAPAPKVAGNGNGNGNAVKGGGPSNGGAVNLTANALAAVNSTPASTSTSTSTRPDSSQSFDFALPSFPPRLSKVGRRISELSTQFLNDLELPDEPSSAGVGVRDRNVSHPRNLVRRFQAWGTSRSCVPSARNLSLQHCSSGWRISRITGDLVHRPGRLRPPAQGDLEGDGTRLPPVQLWA
ncbi:hypothetical protein EHS25_008013 [Saitozyma podzolica]|uniref:Uncharacterized protein n=1 Tax=Saitozyma podzolica TaxID=1890683 RepID=A0A427YN60_9TREE|nr:hypothetical protein EHS25_008013 [Saitozyma podzolica]